MEFKLLKQKIFKLVDFDYSGDLECVDSDCVLASLKNGKGQVGGATIPQLARALFLFAQNVSEGKEEFFCHINFYQLIFFRIFQQKYTAIEHFDFGFRQFLN